MNDVSNYPVVSPMFTHILNQLFNCDCYGSVPKPPFTAVTASSVPTMALSLPLPVGLL